MKKSFYLFAAFCLFSCSNKTYPRFDYNISKNPWIDAFKDHVFFAGLKESYKSDSIITLLQKKDAFNPYDGLSLRALQKAQELGINLVKKMPPPSMCEGCTAGVNYYMATALHYYNSRELDSIAKVYYKEHLREDKVFSK
jgi:hypothetical protein